MTDEPTAIIEKLLLGLPPGWKTSRKSNGTPIHNDVAVYVICPVGHHAKAYFSKITTPVCLSCSEKKDKHLRDAAETIFTEPFSKRDTSEGFLAIHLFLGFNAYSHKETISSPTYISEKVLWFNIPRKKTKRAYVDEILNVFRGHHALSSRITEKLRVFREKRRASRKELPELPVVLAANKYAGVFGMDMSAYNFENSMLPAKAPAENL